MSSVDVVAEIQQRFAAVTDIPVTITSNAVLAALRAFDATKIVLLTPYVKAINEMELRFFAHHNITVLRERGLELTTAEAFAGVSPDQWFDEAVAMRDPQADVYFISCTAVKSAEAVEAIEAELGRPVLTSNQVAMWRGLRDAGITDKLEGFGRLLREH
jgi:maleate isomerase